VLHVQPYCSYKIERGTRLVGCQRRCREAYLLQWVDVLRSATGWLAVSIMSGVSKHTFCGQMFKDYNVLTVASWYMLEVVCYIKRYKDSLEQNIHIHNYNTRKIKLDLHVKICNTDLLRKSVLNMAIILYSAATGGRAV
jgi:hypothetical protein